MKQPRSDSSEAMFLHRCVGKQVPSEYRKHGAFNPRQTDGRFAATADRHGVRRHLDS